MAPDAPRSGSACALTVTDVEANAKLLWSNDWLYVYAKVEDYDFSGPDTANWIGEHIMVVVDGPMYGDPRAATMPMIGAAPPGTHRTRARLSTRSMTRNYLELGRLVG